MDQETKNRLADRSIWVRALYMVILVIAYSIGETLLVIISVFQFLSALVTGKVNESLQTFGANLSAYLYDILQFATFNSEDLPFPFSDWPEVEPGETPWSAGAGAVTPEAEAATTVDVQPLEDEPPATEAVEADAESAPESDDNPTRPSGA
jgi:hypothetical protein